jgi:hypothetical protein
MLRWPQAAPTPQPHPLSDLCRSSVFFVARFGFVEFREFCE